MLAFNLQASKTNVALFSFKHLEFTLTFSQLGEVHREGVQVSMFAIRVRPEEFKLNFTLYFIFAKISSSKLDLIPFENVTCCWTLYLRFVDRSELA